MQIGFEVLADNNLERCDRCKSREWGRIALVFTPSLRDEGAIAFPKGNPVTITASRSVRVIMCIDCLAHAIQSITGWNIRKLLNRYREVSPLYGTVPVGLDVVVLPTGELPKEKKEKRIRRTPLQKGKR